MEKTTDPTTYTGETTMTDHRMTTRRSFPPVTDNHERSKWYIDEARHGIDKGWKRVSVLKLIRMAVRYAQRSDEPHRSELKRSINDLLQRMGSL